MSALWSSHQSIRLDLLVPSLSLSHISDTFHGFCSSVVVHCIFQTPFTCSTSMRSLCHSIHSIVHVLLFFLGSFPPPVSYLSATESLFPTISAAFAVMLQSIFVPIPSVQVSSPFRHLLSSLVLLYFWLSSYHSPNLNGFPQPWALFQNCKGFCMFLRDMNWLKVLTVSFTSTQLLSPLFSLILFFYITHRKISYSLSLSNPSACPVISVLLPVPYGFLFHLVSVSLPLGILFCPYSTQDNACPMTRRHYSYENNISKLSALLRREIFIFSETEKRWIWLLSISPTKILQKAKTN